ncbi:hypothetical protein AXK12_03630 [Cephaloticoccus capnophilus]|uniref:TonB-dependent receptor plug domain-containing protein n=1 Tax=Cephaloticoccus capnophilus TaxID=1548208 RepID=A0A139SNT1_9BACT|nr:TonB-dependent receptor plug domain-containing protein [Cephaloticoccus capnophilus]KXU36239.1 hypothetical protein AXK12_03630 [Cephaloticoccus capnophilus]
MKRNTHLRAVSALPLLALCLVASTPSGFAQRTATDARAETDEAIILSPFEISAQQPARYQAADAASGGRIRTNILNTPSSVTVLTGEFLEDVGSSRFRDAAKYVAGVSESTIPNGHDRVNIRGFQTQGRRIDGFSTFAQANYDSAAVERIEIIKGPDSVLQPAGVPGGTINLVTKRPQFVPGGYVKAQLGQYDANRVEADVTGPFAKGHLAYRVVAAVQDSEGYVKRSYRDSVLVSPSLSWRIAPQSLLTLRYEYLDANVANSEGVPVDPSVGTTTGFKLLEGVPRDFNPAPDKKYSVRGGETHALSFHFSSTITDRLSVRLAGRIGYVDQSEAGFGFGLSTPGGSHNPYTGNWEGGVIWVKTSVDPNPPTFAATPAPALSETFQHFGVHNFANRRERDIQNDWAYIVDGTALKSTTLVGFAYNYFHGNVQTRNEQLPDFTVAGWTKPGAPIEFPISRDTRNVTSRYQVYLTEALELFEGRLVLSGGVSQLSYNGTSGNKLSAANPPFSVAGQMFPGSGNKATYNHGVVVKPLDTLSLYYGHSENAVPAENFEQVSRGNAPVFSQGKQDEFGAKVLLFGGRLIASVAYYEIEQTGYSVYNPANLVSPAPSPLLPDLILSREARGWEFQVTGNITPNLSVIASYDDMKNRDPNGVILRGTPEQTAAAFVRYAVTQGRLAGLAVGIGANYAAKAAGDIPRAGFTGASTPENPIPYQPSFYLPARTIADLYVSYTRGAFVYRVDVSNFTDEAHYGHLSRNNIMVGNPAAVTGSVTFKF